MRFPRVLSLLLVLLLTACPGSSSVNPTDGVTPPNDGGDSSLTLSTAELPPATVSQPYRATLRATGGRAPLTFRVSTGSLPAGLRLEGGSLLGTPTAPGTASFTVEVQDANDRSASASFQLTVRGGLTITPTPLPDAYTGAPYGQSLSASGGQPPYAWALTAGSLPIGLQLLTSGALSGTASIPGTSTFTVRVTDAEGGTDTREVSLTTYVPPTLTTASLPDGYVGEAYSASLTATGGRAPYVWSLESGPLPQGLSLAPSSGALSGTPGAATTASLTVRVTDSGGRTSTRTLSLAVYRPPVLSGPPPQLDGYVGQPFSATYSATDGKPPYAFSTPGPLPAWLSLSGSGLLSGTPPSPGATSGQVIVSDANGRTASRAFTLTAYPLPVITSLVLSEARLGEAYSTSLQSSGGKAPVSWSLSSGALPSGLSLSTAGRISGTPADGTSTFTVRVTDSTGRFEERTLTLPVYIPPRVTTASLPEGVEGQPYSATLTASNGRAPLLWSHGGSLPAGLVLSSTTGALSGTPTAPGTVSVTVSVRDDEGREDSRTLSLTVRGTGSPLTVGHWNIEWFGAPNQGPPNSSSDGGTSDDLQIAHARDILGDAGVNLWGLVEMVDAEDFATLRAQLPGYSGFLANDVSFVPGGSSWYSNGEQKPGILYDSALTYRSAQLILTSQSSDFGGRPPLRVDFNVRGLSEPLVVIVLHMKAFEDLTSYGQRQRAGTALKNYLDTVLPSERVLVIGDWNDDVDRSITRDDFGTYLGSPYEPFVLDSARYTFITQPLSLRGERTVVRYPDAIDHTLATHEQARDYRPGSVRVLRPDAWIPNYANTVSDHYPVLSRYDLGGGGPAPSPSPDLFINEVLANEPSLDGGVGDPHYEFIEVVNAGGSSADLSGWSLWDSAVVRHVFPSGTSLGAGRAFVVYGGPRAFPPGQADTLAASTGQLGLNNDGDIPSLRAPDGGIVDSVSYTRTVDNVSINRVPDAMPDAGFVLHTLLSPGLNSSAGRRADGGAF